MPNESSFRDDRRELQWGEELGLKRRRALGYKDGPSKWGPVLGPCPMPQPRHQRRGDRERGLRRRVLTNSRLKFRPTAPGGRQRGRRPLFARAHQHPRPLEPSDRHAATGATGAMSPREAESPGAAGPAGRGRPLRPGEQCNTQGCSARRPVTATLRSGDLPAYRRDEVAQLARGVIWTSVSARRPRSVSMS